jgi:plasmid maintenance system antidote protein VapI
MNSNKVRAVWISRIPELLEAKGQMLGKGRAVRVDEMAEAIHVSRQTIYAWMSSNGQNVITADSAARLERYFGVSIWNIWRLEITNESGEVAQGIELGQQVGAGAD